MQTVTPNLRTIKTSLLTGRNHRELVFWQDGVEKMSDLAPDMVLEGTVTNVTAFGAFVDIGVHQDGLVHISALADRFVKDPRDVVKSGDIVRVKVMEVDIPRKRISLSMRLADKAEDKKNQSGPAQGREPGRKQPSREKRRPDKPAPEGAFAAAFAAASKRR